MISLVAMFAMLQQPAAPVAGESYRVLVASDGFNQVAMVQFAAGGASIDHRTLFRLMANDSAGPRAVAALPQRNAYFVGTARGFPTGELIQVAVSGDAARGPLVDRILGREPVGGMVESVALTPDGDFAWTIIADSATEARHLAVVYLKTMVEVARMPMCSGARGGVIVGDSPHHFSLCPADDAIADFDVTTVKINRNIALSTGSEPKCRPSSLTASSDARKLFVSCSNSNEIVEVDANAGRVVRRVALSQPVGALAVLPTGQGLVAITRTGRAVLAIDLATGKVSSSVPTILTPSLLVAVNGRDWNGAVVMSLELARKNVLRRASGDVVISPDGRYAFVALAPMGDEGSTVDVIDLATHRVVGAVEVGRGAGAMAFWSHEIPRTAQ